MSDHDWAAYKRRQRAHDAGDHQFCDGENCREKLALEKQEVGLAKRKAVMERLIELGADPADYMDDDLAELVQADVEVTSIMRFQAKLAVMKMNVPATSSKMTGVGDGSPNHALDDDTGFPAWALPGGREPTDAELNAYIGPDNERIRTLRNERS